jgi:hypothetical protein
MAQSGVPPDLSTRVATASTAGAMHRVFVEGAASQNASTEVNHFFT